VIDWCIGCPGAGKTTLARHLAFTAAVAQRRRILAIDCEGDASLRALPRAANVDELRELYARGNRAVTFDAMNATDEELAELARAVERAGSLVLLIDGAHVLLDAHSHAGDAWVRVQRVHRHARLDLVWTTHHLGGDVPQVVQACAPTLHVFRTTSPAALKVLEREYGLDPNLVRSLDVGNFVRVESGFSKST
jgi:hypothetical protein